MSAHGFTHVLPPDGGIGQLSPLARTKTPDANFFAEDRSVRPTGYRKNAQIVSPLCALRVNESSSSGLSASSDAPPSVPSILRTHSWEGPRATHQPQNRYSAASSSNREISLVASPINR